MRLINTHTLTLKEFFGEIPRYGILSHTWGQDEVSFQDFQNLSTASLKAGFAKIEGVCREAARFEIEWCWVDTCCIDKTSSAELSEAINSMYTWYRDADICFAYLADVPGTVTTHDLISLSGDEDKKAIFCRSRWFSRGWTLQELIAPYTVIFSSNDWDQIGTREDLEGILVRATGIESEYFRYPSRASIAKRMSWMGNRKTTRIEDLAYCLLGIFEVNMPLLYGEGRSAFIRLQEEIMKRSNDQTIFCWQWEKDLTEMGWHSILAPYPSLFSKSSSFIPRGDLVIDEPPPREYRITNAGLSIWLPLISTPDTSLFFATLDVSNEEGGHSADRICLPLKRDRIYRRVSDPAMPIALPGYIAAPGKTLYIEWRPTFHERWILKPQEGSRQDVLFVPTLVSQRESMAYPELLYSSSDQDSTPTHLLRFSFSGAHELETTAIAFFKGKRSSTTHLHVIFWLAVRIQVSAEGARMQNSFCGTILDSQMGSREVKTNVVQRFVKRIKEQSDEELKSFWTDNLSSSAVLLGNSTVISSADHGEEKAQLVVFIDDDGELVKALRKEGYSSSRSC